MTLVVRELTAPGRGGISVLAVRGERALERVRSLAPGEKIRAGRLSIVRLTSGGELLDEALVWAESEESVEVHVHGSPPLVRRLREELSGAGKRGHGPDEASAQGLSVEERAEILCAGAASEAAARMLLDQAQGALRREVEDLKALGAAAGHARLVRICRAGRVARHLVRPPQVVLAGPVNAGKSSLFNLLVGHERVVVDAEHGTTRDPVRERVLLGEYAVDLVDTAGERSLAPGQGREAEARIEGRGQALARVIRERSELVVWLDPRGRGPSDQTSGERVRVLASRADEARDAADEGDGRVPSISVVAAPEAAHATVLQAFHEALALPRSPFPTGGSGSEEALRVPRGSAAAAPFEPEMLRILEQLAAEEPSAARWQRALDSVLAD